MGQVASRVSVRERVHALKMLPLPLFRLGPCGPLDPPARYTWVLRIK